MYGPVACVIIFCNHFQPPAALDKPKSNEEPHLLERMIEALHMEMLFVRHRIAVKIAALGQGKS